MKLASIQVEPSKLVLQGKWARQALVVTGQLSDGSVKDLTAGAEFKSANPAIADVGPDGFIRPVADGEVPIAVVAKFGDAAASTQVVVSVKEAANESVSFLRDVLPLFSKLGCNGIQCHGSALGKGGFRLSMFGAEPDADYEALTRLHLGRRINRVEPLKSLVLLKATNAVAHTGGPRIQPNSPEYALLAGWVAQDLPWGDDKLHRPVSVKIWPKDKALAKGEVQQVLARAVYADGSERDVTRLASFASSSPPVATIDPNGKVKAEGFGEAVLSATFMRRSDTARFLIPQPLPAPFPKLDPNNKIDELVWARLQKLGFPPSELASDEVFLRRVYLDAIGCLPKPEEARAFLADPDPAKRTKLIDRLLERDEYADFWALKWGDLLRIKSEYPVRVWPRGVQTYYRWVRTSIAANKPYDQFVRELITANGSDFQVGPANYFRACRSGNRRPTPKPPPRCFWEPGSTAPAATVTPPRIGAWTTAWAWRPSSAKWPSKPRRSGRKKSSSSISTAACTTRSCGTTSTPSSSGRKSSTCPAIRTRGRNWRTGSLRPRIPGSPRSWPIASGTGCWGAGSSTNPTISARPTRPATRNCWTT